VLQTASNFLRGFLGNPAATLGSVIAVTSRGFPEAVGDTLAPADMCPAFADDEGAAQVKAWSGVYVPAILARLRGMVSGNLTLGAGDVTQMPYLCGFESQITGRLSKWCGVLSDEELGAYEYGNDLRYYYGVGPGSPGVQTGMMVPFLNALVGLLRRGPGIRGVAKGGGEFEVPGLMMAFVNDGQLVQLASACGVFDGQEPLESGRMDGGRLWVSSRFVTMRGTVAFERLRCAGGDGDVKPTRTGCRPKPTGVGEGTFLRIRLNDAVYKVPGCDDGPGSSCELGKYADMVGKKLAAWGSFVENCNVTVDGAPTRVKGASFFTDLSSPWLKIVAP
jgi:hypothetical protein